MYVSLHLAAVYERNGMIPASRWLPIRNILHCVNILGITGFGCFVSTAEAVNFQNQRSAAKN
jgi:hypothetical protein